MGLEQATAREIVEKAVAHKWGIPEFQRGFVWTPQKVRDLADSLWRGYPVGSYLVWYSQDDVEPKIHEDQSSPGACSGGSIPGSLFPVEPFLHRRADPPIEP